MSVAIDPRNGLPRLRNGHRWALGISEDFSSMTVRIEVERAYAKGHSVRTWRGLRWVEDEPTIRWVLSPWSPVLKVPDNDIHQISETAQRAVDIFEAVYASNLRNTP